MKPGRWGFVGQNELGASALETLWERWGRPSLVVTRPPKASHINRVEEVAHRAGFDVTFALGYRLDDLYDALTDCDVLVCSGWARRLPARVFDAPGRGSINLHPGALPLWAGSDPLGWRLSSGAENIEVTVHRMTDVIDAGPVLGTAIFAVEPSDTGHDLRRRAGRTLGALAARVVEGGLLALDRSQGPASRATPPRGVTPALEAERMLRRDVDRIVRAFSPHPGVLAAVESEWIRVRFAGDRPAHTVVLHCADGDLIVEPVASQ